MSTQVTLKPQEVRYEMFVFDKTQIIDLGNPAEIEFLNNSIENNVIINNVLLLTTKEESMATKPTFNADWRQKFTLYPNEINKTQYNIRFERIKDRKGEPKLTVICKYYVYN